MFFWYKAIFDRLPTCHQSCCRCDPPPFFDNYGQFGTLETFQIHQISRLGCINSCRLSFPSSLISVGKLKLQLLAYSSNAFLQQSLSWPQTFRQQHQELIQLSTLLLPLLPLPLPTPLRPLLQLLPQLLPSLPQHFCTPGSSVSKVITLLSGPIMPPSITLSPNRPHPHASTEDQSNSGVQPQVPCNIDTRLQLIPSVVVKSLTILVLPIQPCLEICSSFERQVKQLSLQYTASQTSPASNFAHPVWTMGRMHVPELNVFFQQVPFRGISIPPFAIFERSLRTNAVSAATADIAAWYVHRHV